ncbi:MAG: TIGR02147 family protein [Oligoflexus sp.]
MNSKAQFHRDAQAILPSRYLDYKEYLSDLYQQIKSQRDRYSYITFTEELGLGKCNAMYLIVHGKRPLTVKAAKKVVAALGLTGGERQYFLRMVEIASLHDATEREKAFQSLIETKTKLLPNELDAKQLEFHREWYHAAILELLSHPKASVDEEWLAKTLIPHITPSKARRSLELLGDIGYIVFDEEAKKWKPATQVISTGPEVAGMAIIGFHQQMIQLAKESLTRISPYDRNISSVTVSLSKAKQELLKQEIDKLRSRVIQLAEEPIGDEEVVQVNIQMFPIARPEGGNQSD